MRKLLLASAILALVSSSAFAAGGQAAGVVGIAGAFQTNQSGSNSNKTSTFSGNGNLTNDTASGFNATLGASGNRSHVDFTSNGQASANVSASPFGVSSSSQHSGFVAGNTDGNASFTATAQTFGQNTAATQFSQSGSSNKSSFSNQQSGAGILIGFAALEGSFQGGFPQ